MDNLFAGPMLLAAAKRGNLSFMERICGENKKIDLDAKDGLGNTPLHYSAAAGHFGNTLVLKSTLGSIAGTPNFFDAKRHRLYTLTMKV